uniref:Uncharacterized protein n=1 Tax=Triticum urartu TaxID=4572 RepID=A0A8R7QG75_TRIUA
MRTVAGQRERGPSNAGRLLAEGVLVVVHPDLEDVALDAHLVAELQHGRLVVLLDAPPHALREGQHLVLLLLGELGAEPLLAGPGPGAVPRRARAQGHAAQRGQRRHGPRRHARQLVGVVAPAVGGGRERQRPRVPRRGCSGGRGHVVLVVVQVARRGAVVGRELVVRRHASVGDHCGGREGRALAPRGEVGLPPVEVAVAAARGAAERVDAALLAGGDELAAAVDGVPSDADRVVLEALAVPGTAAGGLGTAAKLATTATTTTTRRLAGRNPGAAKPRGERRRGLVAGAHRHGHGHLHLLVAVVVVVEVHARRRPVPSQAKPLGCRGEAGLRGA